MLAKNRSGNAPLENIWSQGAHVSDHVPDNLGLFAIYSAILVVLYMISKQKICMTEQTKNVYKYIIIWSFMTSCSGHWECLWQYSMHSVEHVASLSVLLYTIVRKEYGVILECCGSACSVAGCLSWSLYLIMCTYTMGRGSWNHVSVISMFSSHNQYAGSWQ